MRIVYMGMFGTLSTEPLGAILKHKLKQDLVICGIIVPATDRQMMRPRLLPVPPPLTTDLPMVSSYAQETIIHLGWEHQIPVWEVGSLKTPAIERLLRDLEPDLICVACFPAIFPLTILQIPRLGCLNLHPSLLPDYRGPEPLFWQAYHGETHSGVTLHFLDEGIDHGGIVAQAEFKLPEGIGEADLTRHCAQQGATLLVEALQQAQDGPLPCQAQPAGGRYFPSPKWEDLEIPLTWPAQRAFRFLRGASSWPLKVKGGGIEIEVDTALAYSSEDRLNQPIVFKQDEVWLQLTPGILKVRPKSYHKPV